MGKTSSVINRPARAVFSRLTQTTDIGFAGPLAVLSPLIAGEAQQEEDTKLVRLKKIVERE